MGNSCCTDSENIKYNDMVSFDSHSSEIISQKIFNLPEEKVKIIKECRDRLGLNDYTVNYSNIEVIINGKFGEDDFYFYKGEIVKQNNCNIKEGYGKEWGPNYEYYEGLFKDNNKEGKGVLIYNDNSYYFGDFKENKFDGDGELRYTNGNIKKGSFLNGELHGLDCFEISEFNGLKKTQKGEFENGSLIKGEILYNNIKYIGDFKGNNLNGTGEVFFENGDKYVGDFMNGIPEGMGDITLNGKKYKGDFHKGLKHGDGLIHFNDTDYYEGSFYNDQMEGTGTLFLKGIKYKVTMKNNKCLNKDVIN